MKALIKKNKQYRKEFSQSEVNFYINSALINNKILRPDLKKIIADNAQRAYELKKENKIANLSKVTTKKLQPTISKIRNICVLTGRPRAVFLNYKVSRIKFKELAVAGYLPGVKKR